MPEILSGVRGMASTLVVWENTNSNRGVGFHLQNAFSTALGEEKARKVSEDFARKTKTRKYARNGRNKKKKKSRKIGGNETNS